MNKFKVVLFYPIWLLRGRKVRKITKKSKNDPEKYPAEWKFNYAIKNAGKALRVTGVNVTVHGYENFPKGIALLTPNHQSSADSVIIVWSLKNHSNDADAKNKSAFFVAKSPLMKNKLARKWADFLDTFYIDRKNPKSALVAFNKIARLAKKEKKYIVIFPEGTRSKDGKMQEFKPGVFRLAKKEFIPIVPITINNSFSFSDTKRKGKLKVDVIIHKPLKPITFITQTTDFIAKKVWKIVNSSWKKPILKTQKIKNRFSNV